jgi:hypothetical protein
MRTVIGPCAEGSVATGAMSGGADPTPPTITTTLYDLIAALQEVVDPGEGGTLNCASSADAVAGNGAKRPLRRCHRAEVGMEGETRHRQCTGLHPHPNPPPSRGREYI